MEAAAVFARQILSRSSDHKRAMELLAKANIPGQMMAILRQKVDSMMYLFCPTQLKNEDFGK